MESSTRPGQDREWLDGLSSLCGVCDLNFWILNAHVHNITQKEEDLKMG